MFPSPLRLIGMTIPRRAKYQRSLRHRYFLRARMSEPYRFSCSLRGKRSLLSARKRPRRGKSELTFAAHFLEYLASKCESTSSRARCARGQFSVLRSHEWS